MARKTPPPSENKGRGIEQDKLDVIEKLFLYLQYGLTIQKACNAHNVKTRWEDYISPLTVANWYTAFPEVKELIDALRETGEWKSHQTWIKAIEG